MARLGRAARPRAPVVFTPHQYAFENYFAGRGQRLAYLAIERALAPLANRVIGVCEAERELAARIGPARRTRLVYNGVEALPRVEPSAETAGLQDRGPVVVALVELHPRKGAGRCSRRSRGCREPPRRDRGDRRRRRPARRARGARRAPAARRLGPFPRACRRRPGAARGRDAFVNPAWAEAFPYSVIEAMSVGLPIVATDVGGTGEAIVDGDTGLLVEAREPDALGRAITALLDDRAAACSLGERAARLAAERFTLRRMIDGVTGVYSGLGVAMGDA